MSIALAVMSGGGETTSQRRGGAGGKQTDHGRETVAETDTENERRSPPNKLSDSSTMSGAGKTTSGVKRTKNIILDSPREGGMTKMLLLLRRRCPTLNCQGHSQKIPTHSEGWLSSTTSHLRLAFLSADGDCTLSRMMNPFQSCTFTDRVPIYSGDREELLISPSTIHPAPSNMQYSSIGKNNNHQLRCFTLVYFEIVIVLISVI